MSGVALRIDGRELKVVADRFDKLADFPRGELLDMLGGLVASQTQERIATEKTSPDGEAWAPNLRGGSILVLEGHLLGSIAHQVSGDRAEIGSNLVYAAVHQHGATIRPKTAKMLSFTLPGQGRVFAHEVTIPARPYLGISEANAGEIETALNEWIGERLQ